MRQLIADRVPPQAKQAYADRMHMLRWRRSPAARVTRKFVDAYGLTVQQGPFEGMRFPEYAVGRGELVVPQLLGAYERELHPAFERVIARGYEQVVDVGASDGYYAVGLALKMPQTRVRAFEMNDFPARVCRALAAENGVADRIDLGGLATLDELRALPERDSFVLCDCEGCEDELMDPAQVPLLARSDLIVELHEFAVPDIQATIESRFGATHDIEIVHTDKRYTGEFPKLMELKGVSYMDREIGVSEFRPTPMKWAVMTRKTV
jgi:hypothetical protein